MKDLDKYYDANRSMWDKFAKINYSSPDYRTKDFLNGASVLNSIELKELGDVKGKRLLHLQCHFGLDTLSWAREGASVTGVDFSGEAIALAKDLAEKTNIDATFIQANIYDLPEVLSEQFDIVYTSYGVLCWLPDLKRWAEIIAHFLKPGGTFYIAEGHPMLWVFDNEGPDDFKMVRSYFSRSEPYSFDVDGSYAESDVKFESQKDYEWAHGMGDIITSLVNAGLQIRFLHEHAKFPFHLFPFFKKSEEGYWVYDNPEIQIPLMFSIKATKDI